MMCENDIMIQYLQQSSTTLGLFTDCIIPLFIRFISVACSVTQWWGFSVTLYAGYNVQPVGGNKRLSLLINHFNHTLNRFLNASFQFLHILQH